MEVQESVIVGGGVSGLLSSYVLALFGKRSLVLEPNKLGGDFLLGGSKYIHKTEEVVDMFEDLGLVWDEYYVNGGILLRGKVRQYPKCLLDMEECEAKRIQADHFVKTRQTQPRLFGSNSMNDPGAARTSRLGIRCDFEEMVAMLENHAYVDTRAVKKIISSANVIELNDGSCIKYSLLIVTIPLWVIRQMCDFYVPQGMAMSLNLIRVIPHHDRYVQWDYVYTPYTPYKRVHRISPSPINGYTVEANGDWDCCKEDVLGDLAFLFPDGYAIVDLKTGIKGHLLELQEKPKWPNNIVPMGRFAQWNPRMTMDVTLSNLYKYAKKKGWKQ